MQCKTFKIILSNCQNYTDNFHEVKGYSLYKRLDWDTLELVDLPNGTTVPLSRVIASLEFGAVPPRPTKLK